MLVAYECVRCGVACTCMEGFGMSSSEPVVKLLLLCMLEVLCCGLNLMEVLQPFVVCDWANVVCSKQTVVCVCV